MKWLDAILPPENKFVLYAGALLHWHQRLAGPAMLLLFLGPVMPVAMFAASAAALLAPFRDVVL